MLLFQGVVFQVKSCLPPTKWDGITVPTPGLVHLDGRQGQDVNILILGGWSHYLHDDEIWQVKGPA